MESLGILLPVAAVEVEAVLGKTCEVYRTEERRVAGPITIVRSRFAEVVDPRPDEFAHAPVMILLTYEVIFGEVTPPTVLDIVARGLMVGVLGHALAHDGELIHPTRADRRAGL